MLSLKLLKLDNGTRLDSVDSALANTSNWIVLVLQKFLIIVRFQSGIMQKNVFLEDSVSDTFVCFDLILINVYKFQVQVRWKHIESGALSNSYSSDPRVLHALTRPLRLTTLFIPHCTLKFFPCRSKIMLLFVFHF